MMEDKSIEKISEGQFAGMREEWNSLLKKVLPMKYFFCGSGLTPGGMSSKKEAVNSVSSGANLVA